MRKARQSVCKLNDLVEGVGKIVSLGTDGGDCTVFVSDGKLFATGSLCPHQNSSLEQAPIECGVIFCRRHGFRFDAKSGDCLTIGGYGLPVYDVVVEDDNVIVSYWVFDD
jgi:nitrite reductase/ring-hydroxylating ferredoxin subunit